MNQVESSDHPTRAGGLTYEVLVHSGKHFLFPSFVLERETESKNQLVIVFHLLAQSTANITILIYADSWRTIDNVELFACCS